MAPRTSRRLLDGHPSVRTEDYRIQAPGRDMTLLGLYTLRIGVDTIALDRRGEWLYYGPVTGGTLFRVRTADLNDRVALARGARRARRGLRAEADLATAPAATTRVGSTSPIPSTPPCWRSSPTAACARW